MIDRESSWGLSVLGEAYRQIAAIMGACSLVVFFGHYIQIDWLGIFHALISAWNETVIRFVKVLLDNTVVPLFSWAFHWHIVISPMLRDYCTAGFVLAASYVRYSLDSYALDNVKDVLHTIIVTVICLVFWPLFVAGSIYYYLVTPSIPDPPSMFDPKYKISIILLPFIYGVIMLVSNYALSYIS